MEGVPGGSRYKTKFIQVPFSRLVSELEGLRVPQASRSALAAAMSQHGQIVGAPRFDSAEGIAAGVRAFLHAEPGRAEESGDHVSSAPARAVRDLLGTLGSHYGALDDAAGEMARRLGDEARRYLDPPAPTSEDTEYLFSLALALDQELERRSGTIWPITVRSDETDFEVRVITGKGAIPHDRMLLSLATEIIRSGQELEQPISNTIDLVSAVFEHFGYFRAAEPPTSIGEMHRAGRSQLRKFLDTKVDPTVLALLGQRGPWIWLLESYDALGLTLRERDVWVPERPFVTE